MAVFRYYHTDNSWKIPFFLYPKVWDGSKWVYVKPSYWDGSQWVTVIGGGESPGSGGVPPIVPPPVIPPGGGGGGGSVSVNAFMPLTDKKAGQMQTDDPLLLLSYNGTGSFKGSVISNRISQQRLITLVSQSGIRLTCSDNTPLTLKDRSVINSTEALGQFLPVQDDQGFRWEPIVEIISSGAGPVATIYCVDQCYAAGDEADKYIWTHNETNQKV